jgi:dihydropteroate synthase
LLVDPGIGFGKTPDHNLTLTRRLGELAALGRPIVYGPSRKRFLGEVTGRGVDDRDRATAAACAIAVAHGAHVLRVHDVGAVRDAIAVAAAVRDAP